MAQTQAAIEKRAKLKARLNNPILNLIYAARKTAKQKNIEFNLEPGDVAIPEVCPLLNIPIEPHFGHRSWTSPSLDRIDPKKGYIKGNVWVISWRANDLKRNASPEEFECLLTNWKRKVG